jgi:hypothetical protein
MFNNTIMRTIQVIHTKHVIPYNQLSLSVNTAAQKVGQWLNLSLLSLHVDERLKIVSLH